MSEFLASNEWQWRLLRTIVQGVLGVVVANLDFDHGLVRAGPEHARARGGAGDGGAVAHHGRARRRRRQAGDPEG